MIDGLMYSYKLLRLQRIRRKVTKEFRLERQKAKKDGALSEALDDLGGEEMYEIDSLEDDISWLVTERLRSQACHFLIPVPSAFVWSEEDKQFVDNKKDPLIGNGAADLRSARSDASSQTYSYGGFLLCLL
jgi:hypothetical protein